MLNERLKMEAPERELMPEDENFCFKQVFFDRPANLAEMVELLEQGYETSPRDRLYFS